jgi:2-phosphosulfolactate phosphatase
VVVAAHGQAAYDVRLDWGAAGARALVADARPGDVAVVVDVLSFTTTLSVALDRGILVHPYPWDVADAVAYAEARGAALAIGRSAGRETGGLSLSPRSFADDRATAGIERVVLPSPNGSSTAFALAGAGVRVVGACLRNAAAVARRIDVAAGRVCVVAAGERWPDGSLRPAVEDLWGAGAVLSGLTRSSVSPEASAAVAAYDVVRGRLGEVLPACASGRELVEEGWAGDVEVAAAVDVSGIVPVLAGDVFVDASGSTGQLV